MSTSTEIDRVIKGFYCTIVSTDGYSHSDSDTFVAKMYYIRFHQYRKTSCISRTKSQNLKVSYLVLQLSLLNPLKPGVKSRMKM